MKKFTLKVEGGKLRGLNLESLSEYLKKIDGKEVVVTVESKKDQRSAEQNAYYWGSIVPPFLQFLRDAGFEQFYRKEHAHELLKLRCNSMVIEHKNGKTEKVSLPTSTLTIEEFAGYITRCHIYLDSIGVEIQDVM